MRSVVAPWVVVCFLEAALGGGVKMELPPVRLRSTVQGAYEVRRSGGPVGREDFIRSFMSNNTVIYESVFEVSESDGSTISGNNRLEVEEDSGFPRSYYTIRRSQNAGGERVKEVTVRLYSNVAVVSERQGDDERRRVVALPTGCLFIEGNTANHLSVVLDRYDRGVGGKQTFRAFDPLGVGTTDVAIELVGDTTLVDTAPVSRVGSPAGSTVHYRYFAGASPAVDFFVDASGTIVRVDATANDTEYTLISLEERAGKNESTK